MRFLKVSIFVLMICFSCCVLAKTTATTTKTQSASALQVNKETKFTGGDIEHGGVDKFKGFLGDTGAAVASAGLGAAAGVATTAGLLAATGVGVPLALALGAVAAGLAAWGTYAGTHRAPVCSFYAILDSFQSISHGSWFSPIFNMLFNAINKLAVAVNGGALASWVITILMLMMAFYILFTVMKHIVSFTPIEPAKFLSEIFFPLGRMVFAVWAIKNWSYIFHDVLSPILELVVEFGTQIVNTLNNPTTSYMASISGGVNTVSGTCTQTTAGQGLDIGVCSSLQTFLATVSMNLLVWMAFGATLITDSWGKGALDALPSFKMLSLGLLYFIFTFLVYISFPLKLVDALFRLMFIVVLFPLWCLFWVIPQTRDYFKKMINLLINVMATLLSASVIMVMVITLLSSLFDGIPLRRVIELLEEDKAKDAMNLIGFSTSGLFYSIGLLFMAFHLVGKVDYFANIFAKQDSMGIGAGLSKNVTQVVQRTPQALNIAKNTAIWGAGLGAGIAKLGFGATKWGVDKAKGGVSRFQAKRYNANSPDGKLKDGTPARQSPRFWTAPLGGGLLDRYRAKNAIGSYQRTNNVSATGVKKLPNGSTQQTYSNQTVDKKGNVLAKMKETTSSNANKSQQTVDRNVTRFDNSGNVRKVSDVKKDFENGKAVRKTTTIKNKDGTRTELSVDKNTGLATKTRFDADGKKLSSETRDRFGNRTTAQYENGRMTEENTRHRDGTSTQTLHGINGDVQRITRDAEGTVRGSSTNFADGSTQTIRYSKERGSDGRSPASFERVRRDAGGQKTEHVRVDLKNDSFTDMLTGATGKWSGRGQQT